MLDALVELSFFSRHSDHQLRAGKVDPRAVADPARARADGQHYVSESLATAEKIPSGDGREPLVTSHSGSESISRWTRTENGRNFLISGDFFLWIAGIEAHIMVFKSRESVERWAFYAMSKLSFHLPLRKCPMLFSEGSF